MFLRKLPKALAMIVLLFLITACNSPVSKETDVDDSEAVEEQTLPEDHLQKGDQNKSVQVLQNFLQKIDYPIESTGKFDADTTWAITDFQLQQDNLHATGVYDADTMQAIEMVLEDQLEVNTGSGLERPEKADSNQDIKAVANPYEILSLVNKENALPADYIPSDLVTPNIRFPFTEELPKKQMRAVAAEALEAMFEAGDDAGVDLFAQSGYRSFDRQEAIFASYSEENGEEAANKYSARPGESEHQSGLTMDVTSPDINYDLNIDFGDTDEGKWVKEHAAEFGYIIRYPKGKENITKYQFEPWHLRYVGKKAAKEISEEDLTLEEYIKTLMK